ncbi:hypothetical protein MKW92_004733, partial [Papaver armeniacum]
IDVKKMKIVVSPAQQPFRVRKENKDRFWRPQLMHSKKWGNEYESPLWGRQNGCESQQLSDKEWDGFASISR